MVEDRVEVTARRFTRSGDLVHTRAPLSFDCGPRDRFGKLRVRRQRLIFALRASAMTCSNSFMLKTPGTRYLPTMKDGVPLKPKASACSLLRLRMASMSLPCA